MNIDRKKCFHSDSSIPAAATFFPMSAIAIVKPILEHWAYCKACMPNYQNVATIDVSAMRAFDLYSIVQCKFVF